MSKIMVGKTINAIKLADDKEAILFVTDAGEIIARCDADCCSSTWVEHIELPAKGFPAMVLAVDDLDLPGSDNSHPEFDCLQVYGCKITTDKGEIVIDYRNSSNGYYGGNLSWPDDKYFYGGVYGQNVSKMVWVDVTADI
jgi:hypothetical protein